MSVHNLIITYKQIAIAVLSFSLILQLARVALTYWKHYIPLMRFINWVKFISYCFLFIFTIYICVAF